jgi:hypothetical protein
MEQRDYSLLPQWRMDKLYKSLRPGARVNQRSWGWVSTWVTKFHDGGEERGISVRLPIFGHAYSMAYDEIRRAQLIFYYLGTRGCFIGTYFPSENQ